MGASRATFGLSEGRVSVMRAPAALGRVPCAERTGEGGGSLGSIGPEEREARAADGGLWNGDHSDATDAHFPNWPTAREPVVENRREYVPRERADTPAHDHVA